jgi:MFS family permease
MRLGEKVNTTFRAFQNRNYALFFTGQTVSQIGTWMQRTAVSWVVYSMTDSTFMLGLTVFASQFPSFLLSLYGGIVSDRYDRFKILLITQIASMVQAIVLAVLILTNNYNVWLILALSVILGIINAFDVPARQPLIHEMVNDPSELSNAIALNSSMVNLAKLIGPALSGLILQQFGAGVCFFINAFSFVAVLVSLLLMKFPAFKPPTVKKKIFAELTEGFQYLKRAPQIAMILLLLGSVSLLVTPYDTLIPVFAKVIFKGDAATFGYISSFIGLGALAGTLFLASLKSGHDLKKVLLANTFILGIALIGFSLTSYFPLTMTFAILAGFGAMAQTTICITIIQIDTEASMRGRVISYVAMSVFGMLPLGSLLIGSISQRIGAPITMLCQGTIALIIAAVFFNLIKSEKFNRKDLEQLEEAEAQ